MMHPSIASEEKGATLLIFILVLVLASSVVLFKSINVDAAAAQRNRITYAALNEAKQALLGYALQNTNSTSASRASNANTQFTALPCPDTNNDGNSNNGSGSCVSYIGWLPWSDLGIPPLSDGYGQCLWYALSPVFREKITVSNRQDQSTQRRHRRHN